MQALSAGLLASGSAPRAALLRWLSMRAISVDRMSYKDASANQAQDYRDCFNHFDAPTPHYKERLIARACFKIASSARRNGFIPDTEKSSRIANQKPLPTQCSIGH